MSNYPFVRVAERYPGMEPYQVELLYNLSGQDYAVTDMACSILNFKSIYVKTWLETLEGQIDLINFARKIVNNNCK